jgi:hypothetical protein
MKRKFEDSNFDNHNEEIHFVKKKKLFHDYNQINSNNIILDINAVNLLKTEFVRLQNENVQLKKEFDGLDKKYNLLLNEYEILRRNSLMINFSNKNIF